MSLFPIAISFPIFIAPIVVSGIWQIVRTRREAARAESEALPFDPPPQTDPATGQNLAQSRFLKQQLQLGVILAAMLGWTFAYIFCMPLLNVDAIAKHWFNPAAWIWYTFLSNAIRGTQLLSMMVILCAMAIVTPLRFGAEARFYRTRPIRIGFLFWSRLLPTLLGLLTGAALGMLAAFAILAAWKGHVWQNLPPAIPSTLGPEDADLTLWYADLLATSVPSLCLSILTGIALLFTATLALGTSPLIQIKSTRTFPLLILPLLFLGFGVIQIATLAGAHTSHVLRYLFIYTQPSAPPPYAFALVPILLSAAFIGIARLFANRMEV